MSNGRPVGNGYANPWSKLPNESSRAFEAFNIYCRMRPSQRSLKAAYRLFTGNPEAKNGNVKLNRWSQKFNWTERVAAYEKYIERKRMVKATEDRLQMYDEQAELGRELRIRGKQVIEANRIEETEVSDGIKMVVEGVKIERTSRGEPEKTDKLEISGKMTWLDIMSEMKRKTEEVKKNGESGTSDQD